MYMLYDNHRIKIGRIVEVDKKTYVYDEYGTLIFIIEKDEEFEGVFSG